MKDMWCLWRSGPFRDPFLERVYGMQMSNWAVVPQLGGQLLLWDTRWGALPLSAVSGCGVLVAECNPALKGGTDLWCRSVVQVWIVRMRRTVLARKERFLAS